jgi:hypothetical protein
MMVDCRSADSSKYDDSLFLSPDSQSLSECLLADHLLFYSCFTPPYYLAYRFFYSKTILLSARHKTQQNLWALYGRGPSDIQLLYFELRKSPV